MPRLLLINPSQGHRGLGNTRATAFTPLNLPYLAAVTPADYTIDVIDENIEPFRFRDADIVGITAYTSAANRAYQIAGEYRKRGIPTIMGGIHASMMPDEALQYCDAVAIGEAEGLWPKIIGDFEAGRPEKRYHGEWVDLARLPLPRRDIIRNPYYQWGSIQTSRGCPMNCNFCSVTAFNGRRYRRRPLEAVIEELKQIPQRTVLLADDNIIGYGERDLAWARAFFARIIDEGIRKIFFAQTSLLFGEDPELARLAARAGLKVVFVGMESVNPATLKSYGKRVNLKRLKQNRYRELIGNIRSAGIAFLGAFMVGSDEDDVSMFHPALEFIRTAGIDILQVTKTTPLPGTALWDTLTRDNRILDRDFPKAWENYRFSRMLFEPAKMSIEDVYQGYAYIKTAYFDRWETIKRTLSTLLATKSPVSTYIAWKLNASYRKAFFESDIRAMYNQPHLKKKFGPKPI